ncbi:MAG: hypothetical protein U1E27_14100, partial [Kiritimatiellia bacterium]|nr:hypothetical protein [Kiritimatiellia bacterium]
MKADRHGPDPRKRRVHFAFRLAPLLILAAVLIGSRPLVDWAVGALSVRRVARAWRIPATPEVRDLIRAALIDTRTPRPAATLRPARDPSIAPDESAPFSARYSHADLRAEGLIRITLFVSDPDLRPRLQDWIASAMKARPDLNIQLKTTRNEFLEALGRDDMVLFWGHANLGRGLHFDPAPDSPREFVEAQQRLFEQLLPRPEAERKETLRKK